MYDIEITYQTGNSFGTHIETDMLEIPMQTLEVAKENLRRIKEHYAVYQQKESYSRKALEVVYPDFYIEKTNGIILKLDEGIHAMDHPFWTGYFETLISAKIVTDTRDMEFTV